MLWRFNLIFKNVLAIFVEIASKEHWVEPPHEWWLLSAKYTKPKLQSSLKVVGTHNFDAQKVREGRGERGEGRGERGEGRKYRMDGWMNHFIYTR